MSQPTTPDVAAPDEHPIEHAVERVLEPVSAPGRRREATERHIAPGGWRRAVVGVALGVAAGALVALVAPRDEGPRRRVPPSGRPLPYEA